MSTVLSIVIPTKNRSSTCIQAVKAILDYNVDFELLVFDTSDVKDWQLELPRDSRLKVENGSPDLNIVQCFESATSKAAGDYVCVIGDDDGITPALLHWVDEARRLGFESVSSRETAYALYNWPDIRSKYFGKASAGKLYVRTGRAPVCIEPDIKLMRAEFSRTGMQGCGALPRIYHGLVSRRVLLDMLLRFGLRFTGVSPDVSFSYLASLVVTRHLIIDEPLTISGSSGASNAGRSAMREHYGDLWSDPHMARFRGEPWPAGIPEFFSVETVWAQAGVRAMQIAGQGEDVAYPYGRLCAQLYLRYSAQRKRIMASWRVAEDLEGRSVARRLLIRARLLTTAGAIDLLNLFKRIRRKLFGDVGTSVFSEVSLISASHTVRRFLERQQ